MNLLKQCGGPEPKITPEGAFTIAVFVIVFWFVLNYFACPWCGTAHIPGLK